MRTRLMVMAVVGLSALLAGCGNRWGSTFRSEPGGPRGAPAEAVDAHAPAAPEREAGDVKERSGEGYRKELQAGTLTAGSFDDCADGQYYYDFVGPMTDGGEAASLAERLHARPIVLRVRDGADRAVGQASVRIRAEQTRGAVALRTRTDGRCVVLAPWDGLAGAETLSVEVTAPGASEAARFTVGADRLERTLTLPEARGKLPDSLDLAFIVDCTGSMSDELEYLKVEIRHIAEAVAQRFPAVRQRYALIVYRDKGDEYVTRVFDFSDSLAGFTKDLGRQSAAGGGDYPEAVDEALAAAGQLRWSEGNAARVAFHVADAPPHGELCDRALRAVDPLRARAVAVYPVASSGVGDLAELTMRTEALLTGSEYLFLTDDSGVGNAHAKPHFPHYHVQTLRRAMTRAIASELSGRRLAPDPAHIIRTVRAPEEGRQ